MCGFAGIVYFDGRPVSNELLEALGKPLHNRGPDAYGKWSSGNIGLVHRRLTILDLSSAGNQPMVDPASGSVIVYNGEIYNHLELKNELTNSGERFFSTSDTEVLQKIVVKRGMEKGVKKLKGMFSFAQYDAISKCIYLVRDKLGKKPLYYYQDAQTLIFSSDIRSIIPLAGKLNIDKHSLNYYFSELSVPQPHTIFRQIKQVMPGCILKIDSTTGKTEESSFYGLQDLPEEDSSMGLEEAIEKTEFLLKEAIRRRRIADVPVAFCLSSGIDSGLINAIAAGENNNFTAYTVGIGKDEDNEVNGASFVSGKLGIRHKIIQADDNRYSDKIGEILGYFGEPFADTSFLPSYLMYHAISSSEKVALTGDGGDELFGGYGNYIQAYKSDCLQKKYKSRIGRNLYCLLQKAGNRLGMKLDSAGTCSFLSLKPHLKNHYYTGLLPGSRKAFFQEDYLPSPQRDYEAMDASWNSLGTNSVTGRLMRISLRTRLLNDYLVKIDRMSMMNSLEIRSPFLDDDLLDFSFSIPESHKFNGLMSKFILKKLALKYGIIQHSKGVKRGFSVSLENLMLNKIVKTNMLDILSSLSNKKQYNNRYLLHLINKMINNNTLNINELKEIWLLFCYETWYSGFDKRNLIQEL